MHENRGPVLPTDDSEYVDIDSIEGYPGRQAPHKQTPAQISTQNVLSVAPDTGAAMQSAPLTPAAGSHAASNSGASVGTSIPASGTASASPFVINVSWDSSVQSAPSGFTSAVLAAIQYLETTFTDPVTVNIDVGYGEVAGSTLGSGLLGGSRWYLTSYSYSQIVNALAADAKTASDVTALASLPVSSPVNGTYWLTTAQAKALGLASTSGSSIDGYVGFSSNVAFDYNPTDGISAGTYDFNGIVLHEITEVMGRDMLTGGTIGSTSNSYSLLDLFHWSGSGVRDFSASTPGYFSIDGGSTNLATFNTSAGGDAGDWASSMPADAFQAFLSSGTVNGISGADLTTLDTIGWDLASAQTSPSSSPSAPPTSSPTSVWFKPIAGPLASAQSASGLIAGSSLVSLGQVGGASGDSYSYALGGTGAGSFILSSVNNIAQLLSGVTGVTGLTIGALYRLNITATDVTAQTHSPAIPLDVVIGSGGNDKVDLAALVGSSSAGTPTFIYGLAGADSIDGTGMTGQLWFASGSGADLMTGGIGANTYLYGATSDSASASMDTISNFNASKDVIDLTGLDVALSYSGRIPHQKLAPHSVGWQVIGGNTYVYVNASSSNETLGSANMQIELRGAVLLSSTNIVHL